MNSLPVLIGLPLLCLAGCCSMPPTGVRMVPTSTVYTAEPQPTSTREFRAAERQGYLVAATGRGTALGIDDRPVEMVSGERLHVLRFDPASGEALVCRLDSHSLARLSSDGVEIRGTTFSGR